MHNTINKQKSCTQGVVLESSDALELPWKNILVVDNEKASGTAKMDVLFQYFGQQSVLLQVTCTQNVECFKAYDGFGFWFW